jgi:transcriptional regulator with XRE-family HTH domain
MEQFLELQRHSLTGEQLRAARALLRMEQSTLAAAAGVSVETIKRLEAMEGAVRATRVDTLDAVVAALERAGVEFIHADNSGPGVRLRVPK